MSIASGTSVRSRSPRIVPATVGSILVIACGVVLGYVFIAHSVGVQLPPSLATMSDAVADLTPSSTLWWVVAVVCGVLGLLAVLSALVPGRKRGWLLESSDGVPGHSVMSESDVAALLRSQVEQVDGVGAFRLSVQARTVHVNVATPMFDREGVKREVTTAVQACVDRLHVAHTVSIKVHVREGG